MGASTQPTKPMKTNNRNRTTSSLDFGDALNMTLAGVVAHQSALKGGEWMTIPQYDL
ncbi:hypothetical protein N9F36_07865 [Akkermansiaceae bacterium]|nr:hypothetical protein [Akkermansiaceae bacterium]